VLTIRDWLRLWRIANLSGRIADSKSIYGDVLIEFVVLKGHGFSR